MKLKKKHLEKVGFAVSGACIAFVVALVGVLVFMIASQGVATFATDGVDPLAFLASTVWNPHATDGPFFGALPMIVGSLATTALAILIALPVAVASAVFITQFAPRFGSRVFRPMLELLVGIPSVVYGLLGLEVVVGATRAITGGTGYGILPAAIVLALMVLPTITTLAAESIAAVPKELSQASMALGCGRWHTIRKVVLPHARSGILCAVVLGMARAFGEALAVQMVVGNAATMPDGLFTPASTLTSVLTSGIGNEVTGTVYANALWSLALVLLAVSLVFILIARRIANRKEA
jgi:phosphate transport system permease protein